jgi:ribonuclease P protein component
LIDTLPDQAGSVRLRDARLVHKADFDRVFADNQRARTDYVMVMARPNQVGYPRLGMVVAKRLLARAVDRNRVKRCTRESFRQVMAELPACDFVVRLIAKPVAGDEARDLSRTFKRAGHRAMAKWPAVVADEPPIVIPVSSPN